MGEGVCAVQAQTDEVVMSVLITGASGGLGLEFAKLFAKDKNDLVLVARSADKLDEVKERLEKEYGVTVHTFAADLSKESSADEIYAYATREGLAVTTLVNNAGFGDFGEFAACDWDKQRDMVNLNVLALMRLTKLFIPSMKENKMGKILNLASVAAFQPGPLMSVYYASKAFVLSFSEALHVELKPYGITVTALCPGPVKTGFEKAANLKNSGLFKNLKVASPQKVALYGYKKLRKGKAVAIQGAGNKLLIFISRFAPRSLVRRIVYKIQKVR